MKGPQQMAAHPKDILHDAVDGRKALKLAGRLEAPHLAFPLPGRLMRDLGAVVRVPIRTVDDGGHGGARQRIAAELVRDETARLATLSLQQFAEEPHGRWSIATRLHKDIDHVTVSCGSWASSDSSIKSATRVPNLTVPAGTH